MQTHCKYCGNLLSPTQQKETIPPKEIVFYKEGNKISANAIRYNDAFYEITEGKYNGSLVHIWDIINQL